MAIPQAQQSPYSMEEFARRGDERYQRDVRPRLGPGNDGKFVAIDIETGDYELAADELAAMDQLLARRPGAQIWLTRVGLGYAYRFGVHRGTAPPPTLTSTKRPWCGMASRAAFRWLP